MEYFPINPLGCPCTAHADFECSLVAAEASDKIARRDTNSAAATFVCTFDTTETNITNLQVGIARLCVI
jgi:hypothetical protein